MSEAPSKVKNPTPGSQAEPVNPFIGAESFRTGDKIFGRDREIEEFATRLLARRVVLLHSPSGAGKTSLVQAGVIPALNKKGVHILPKVRLNNELPADRLPAGAPSNRYLSSVLLSLDAGMGIPDEAHLTYAQIADLSLKTGGVLEYLETHAPYLKDTLPKRRLGRTESMRRSLIFFDQFEEILTLDPTDTDVKKDFFVHLAPLLNDYRTVAIFAMREEFVAGLEAYLVYLPERLSARFRLELLGREAAMDAISKPARRVHVSFEKKGAELLVERLSQVTVREGGQEVKKSGQYVEPVQLQVVCRDLFERRARPDMISTEDVEAQGSIENALGAYYDKKIKEVAQGQLEAERLEATRKLEQAIATRQEADPRFSKIYASDAANLRLKQRFYLERLSQRIQEELDSRLAAGGQEGQVEKLKAEQEALQDLSHLFDAESGLADPEKAVEGERMLRDWIEQELIVSGRLRGQTIAGEETKFGLDKSTIEKLVQAFLVREEPRRGLVWYELSHDSLVRPVVGSNLAWRELHASEFEIQAARWNKAPGEERDNLLPTAEILRKLITDGEARLESLSEEQKAFLRAVRKRLEHLETHRDNRADLGVNLEDTGWGVIFAASATGDLREALKPLLDLRRDQATKKRSTYYREFFGADGYRPGETAQRFLARWDAGSGLANPDKMPYYLLIVGDPETIPFEFQYGLDVQYAVGRIAFETLEEYTRYARSVVLSETKHAQGSFDLPNRMVVFASQSPDDRPMVMAQEYLVKPLLEALPNAAPNWVIDSLLVDQATKANLNGVLGGLQTPALLFTASHAMSWPKGHPDQLLTQGAPVTQDWPGPTRHRGPFPKDFYFSAQDVPAEGNLLGSIIFFFGDFIAGTPLENNFPFSGKSNAQLAERAFLASLPQKLLSHPQGGALAVVAHVDRAWMHSFMDIERANPQGQRTGDIDPYRKLLARLMQGSTAGMAMEDLNRRYSYFSTALADELVGINFYDRPRDENKLLQMMTQTIDARNYILVGDPAVRLPVRADLPYKPPPDDWERPVIAAVSAPVAVEEPVGMEAASPEGEQAVQTPGGAPSQAEREVQAPAAGAEAPEAEPQPATPEPEGINLDSLANALLKGQKLKLSDFK